MGLIILIAALAIDVSSWYTKRHQAQVTADSAALAGANCLAQPNVGATGSVCTSSIDTTDATTVAVAYANQNGLPITAANVNISLKNHTVTVTPQTTGPLLFAGITLSSPPAIGAQAVAGWKGADCTSAGSGCAFAFAADNVCSGTTGVNDTGNNGPFNHGVSISKTGTGSGFAITGAVISASSITATNNGNPTYASTATYPSTDANGTSCVGSHTPTPASPSPFQAVVQQATSSAYPIDYRLIYPACNTTATTTSTTFGPLPACDSNGFPAYCSAAQESVATTVTISTPVNAIYCDAGTGNPHDPSTWNGAITVNGAGNATYIGGSVTLNIPSNSPVTPATGGTYDSNLLAYAAECNASSPLPGTCPTTHTSIATPAIYMTSTGNSPISGDFFAPAGLIDSQFGGTPTITGFLEGWDVVYNAHGTVTGQGPPVTNQAIPENDWLAQ